MLEAIPNSVLILAGSNDQKKVADFFSEDKKTKSDFVWGRKTPIMGWAIDVFLEPFHAMAGFAALGLWLKVNPCSH